MAEFDIGDLFGMGQTPSAEAKPEKGVQLHGRKIDGVQYVRLEDVCELLRTNGVLPKLERSLRGKL